MNNNASLINQTTRGTPAYFAYVTWLLKLQGFE